MALLKKGDPVHVVGYGDGVVVKDFGKKVRVKVPVAPGVSDVPIVDKALVAPLAVLAAA